MKKLWQIQKSKHGYYICWRWSNERGTLFHNYIGTKNNLKFWKTLQGVTKFGLKEFGHKSENNGKI